MKSTVNPKEFFADTRSHPSKQLGQNFIKDFRVIDRILDVAELCSEDEVLEIGPGLGALTFALADKAKRVIAIEKDKKLSDYLNESFHNQSNVELINQDALKVNYNSFYNGNELKVIANLPYSVSTPVLFKLLEARQNFSTMVLMLQLE
ncbi:MAG: rRNA adenine dimethyltransferase family protein, partial [Thermodesulfobacteriota bacterium]